MAEISQSEQDYQKSITIYQALLAVLEKDKAQD